MLLASCTGWWPLVAVSGTVTCRFVWLALDGLSTVDSASSGHGLGELHSPAFPGFSAHSLVRDAPVMMHSRVGLLTAAVPAQGLANTGSACSALRRRVRWEGGRGKFGPHQAVFGGCSWLCDCWPLPAVLGGYAVPGMESGSCLQVKAP